jgi:hypothetical protein
MVPGATLFSDWLTVAIPVGAKFYVRCYHATTSNLVYTDNSTIDAQLRDPTGGDIDDYTASDQTMGATMVDVGSSQLGIAGPLCILGVTRRPTFAIIGDSRCMGNQDTVDANAGDSGSLARTIGQSFGYCNMATTGAGADSWLPASGGSVNRRALLQYASHVASDLLAAELLRDGAAGQATAESNLMLLLGYPEFAAKLRSFFMMTTQPSSTSTDNWATVANQTPNATQFYPGFTALNMWLRQTFPVRNLVDTTTIVQDWSRGIDGIWRGDTSPDNLPFTPDGLHPSQYGYQKIMTGLPQLGIPPAFDPRRVHW